MTSQALSIWQRRNARQRESISYLIYQSVIVALVVVVPALMLLWSVMVTPAVIASLLTENASTVTMVVVVLVWSAALILGRLRGPAVRAPLLTSVLSAGPERRAVAFRGPVAGGVGIVVGIATFAGAVISAALWTAGSVTLAAGAVFIVASFGVGLIAGSAWLVGQIFPRWALPAGLMLAVVGSVSALVSPLAPLLPWGWAAAAYPNEGSLVAAVTLLVVALLVLVVAVAQMEHLRRPDLEAQAQRWDTAQVFASTLDLGSASAVYQARPKLFRTVRAVLRVRSHVSRFFLRDAVGAVRTPSRATMGAVSLTVAGVIVGCGLTPTPFWGAAAGLLVYLGMGPLSDGLRHAAAMSGDLPLYGISDRLLVASHVTFPASSAVLFVGVGSIVAGVVHGNSVAGMPLFASVVATVMLSIAVRVATSLKGPMPITLLAPASTPMGDIGAVTRLLWMFDGLLLAAMAGLLCLTGAWLLASVELVFVAFLLVRRWTRRRHD